MPRFPKNESDVLILADAMLAGYTANPTIFPSADTVAMNAAMDAYIAALHNQQEKMSLAQQATGTELPVAALFDWLRGTATAAPGWDADLSQLPEGRLLARRMADSAPAVELRILLER